MARSTKADKARQLNAARHLLQRGIPLPEAVRRLSREFDLSGRQAYRYLEQATHLDRPVEVSRGYGADDAQTPGGNGASSSGVCEKQWADDRCDRDTRVGGVSEYSEKAWLSRAQRAAGFKFTLTICLIGCTTRSSPRLTAFLCPFGSAPSAAV